MMAMKIDWNLKPNSTFNCKVRQVNLQIFLIRKKRYWLGLSREAEAVGETGRLGIHS